MIAVPLFLAQCATRLLSGLDPEWAHRLTIRAMAAGFTPRMTGRDDPILAVDALGRRLPNPVGLAAGFDKNAEAIAALASMGWGFIEVGGVTPRPQMGNPRPRLFRLREDRAIINRMGFNNDGMEQIAARLTDYRGMVPVGVNLGANKDSSDRAGDYEILARRFSPLAAFLTINVSSPNTPGLRALQKKDELDELLTRAKDAQAGAAQLWLKIAPDITDEDCADIASLALKHHLDGLVISNTTILRGALQSPYAYESGGLSGQPLFQRSTALLADFHHRLGSKVMLVGVGGIETGAQAYAKIRAGATLVQLYSALVFQGPAVLPRLKTELAACLRRDGFNCVAAAVGAN